MSWISSWFRYPKKPVDVVPVNVADRTQWLRVWRTLQNVNIKELWPVVLSVPAIVFFAISGFIAWVYLVLRAIVLFVRKMFR